MKSIWLPLALLAGTFATPEATAQGAGTDKAIIQAKKELEAARARLDELLSNEVVAPHAKTDGKIEWIALDDVTSCEAEASCEVAASCDSETQVSTHAFVISDHGEPIELELDGDTHHGAHGLSFVVNGCIAELEDVTYGIDADVHGTTEGYEVIDLGDGRTMMITIAGHDDDVSDFFVGGNTTVAPQMLWSTTESSSDCSGGCPTCCDGPSMENWLGADETHADFFVDGGEAHGYFFSEEGEAHSDFFVDGGEARGFFFSDEGEGGDHHDFWGEGEAEHDMWVFDTQAFSGHAAPKQVAPQSDCCGSCGQGAHAAPQPRFPRGHHGSQQMHRMPRMGNGPHSMQGMTMGHGGPQGRMPRQMRGAWMGATPHQGHTAPQGQMRIQLQGMGQAHPQHGLFGAAPGAQIRVERRAHAAVAPQAQAWGKLLQNDAFFVGSESECESSCDSAASSCEAQCEVEVSCESAAPACELQCEVEVEVCEEAAACGSDCGDCGDCGSACETSEPVEVEMTFEVADIEWQALDQGADIDALLAELEIELGDYAGHHVVKVVELDGGGDYDEIDALIAEIEADLMGTTKHEMVKVVELDGADYVDIDSLIAEIEADLMGTTTHEMVKVVELDSADYVDIDALIAEIEADLEVIEEPVLRDAKNVDSEQARIQELETEVSELRELVESLVKELNQR